MRWVTAVLAGTLAAPVAAQQAPAVERVEVTLAEAIHSALRVQPSMVQAAGGVRTAGALVRVTNGSFLPSVFASAGSSRSGGSQIVGNQVIGAPARSSFSGGISANLDLFTG